MEFRPVETPSIIIDSAFQLTPVTGEPTRAFKPNQALESIDRRTAAPEPGSSRLMSQQIYGRKTELDLKSKQLNTAS